MSAPDEPQQLDIHNDFWEVYRDLVALVWYTDKEERLGVVRPFLYEEFGKPGRSDVYERVEYHVLRTVAFMEHFANHFERQDTPA